MDIIKNFQEDTTVISIVGRMDSLTSSNFEKFVNDLSVNETKKISVDLSKMEYISSAGLRTFLLLAKKTKANHGRLVIHSLVKYVQQVFEVTGFSNVLTLCKDNETALLALTSE